MKLFPIYQIVDLEVLINLYVTATAYPMAYIKYNMCCKNHPNQKVNEKYNRN